MRASQRQQSSIGGTIGTLVDTHYRERAHLFRLRDVVRVVAATANLIHELQKERGLSSAFLAGGGRAFAQELASQVRTCDDTFRRADAHWEILGPQPQRTGFTGAVANAQSHLEGLAGLRRDVQAGALTPVSAVQRYTSMIDRLLVVVAEAPGNSPNPQMTLALLALFNFVLAKEYTGQERALGSAVCAQGQFEPFQFDRFLVLGRQREEALEVFGKHTSRGQTEAWDSLRTSEAFVALEDLRAQLVALGEGTSSRCPPAKVWFDHASAVIDALKSFETVLLADLDHLCLQTLAEARSAWEVSQEHPDDQDKLSLVRLERQHSRILEERHQQRQGGRPASPSADPARDLANASAKAVEEAGQWRRGLDTWGEMVREVAEAARGAKLLSLDALIRTNSRERISDEARDLSQRLSVLSQALAKKVETLQNAADRSLSTLVDYHGLTLQALKQKEST